MIATARPPRRLAPRAWIVLILLAAAALRLVALSDAPPGVTGVPPGMTHDEADHGLTAWRIVNGARAIYFPIGYGREPLYDYATAVVMRVTGPTILAARLTSVYFSLLMIAAVYAWARLAFGAPVALLTAAGLAGGFWPLMTARQALRSGALPAVFALAVLVFWRAMAGSGRRRLVAVRRPPPVVLFAIAGLLLGLTFYTYLPARVMWLALPLLWLWGGLATRPTRGLLIALGVAAAVAAPLLLYLAANPALEVRVGELSAPLRAAAGGDFGPLWANATAALRLFTIKGDAAWRYNIPGRPFLPWPLSWLFYGGLAVAGWLVVRGVRRRETTDYTDFTDYSEIESVKSVESVVSSSSGAFLALAWLALGFAPVLVTGPGLSTTQAIGAQPMVYLFPALALVALGRWLMEWWRRRTTDHPPPLTNRRPPLTAEGDSPPATRHSPTIPPAPLLPCSPARLAAIGAAILYTALAATTARAYFGQWANHAEVRVQYETTMVTALRRLDEIGGAAAVSTITPGPFHTPAVALLTLRNPTVAARYFDGRESLLLPAVPDATLVIPGFTPLPPALRPYLAAATLVEELPMRPDDLDRPVRIYAVDGQAAALERMTADGGGAGVRFGESIELLGFELSTGTARAGETVTLVTAWRVLGALPGAALFTHLGAPDGTGAPLAQADSLGAPGEGWVAGDTLLQLHTIPLPAGLPPGEYALAAGVYTRPDGARLTLAGGGDRLTLATLTVESDE